MAWGCLGPPLQMLPSCPSPPPGAQRYIIYKVLKFGVSWGGTTACPLGPFLFSENHSWDCRPRCWGHMPQPLHHPCCLSRGKGGTVPVIIKHEFNYAHCLSALWPAPSGEGVWIGGQPPFQSWHCSTLFPVTGHPSFLFPCL